MLHLVLFTSIKKVFRPLFNKSFKYSDNYRDEIVYKLQ